jgi:hypothetical protein
VKKVNQQSSLAPIREVGPKQGSRPPQIKDHQPPLPLRRARSHHPWGLDLLCAPAAARRACRSWLRRAAYTRPARRGCGLPDRGSLCPTRGGSRHRATTGCNLHWCRSGWARPRSGSLQGTWFERDVVCGCVCVWVCWLCGRGGGSSGTKAGMQSTLVHRKLGGGTVSYPCFTKPRRSAQQVQPGQGMGQRRDPCCI